MTNYLPPAVRECGKSKLMRIRDNEQHEFQIKYFSFKVLVMGLKLFSTMLTNTLDMDILHWKSPKSDKNEGNKIFPLHIRK